jgi:hypothetical protein
LSAFAQEGHIKLEDSALAEHGFHQYGGGRVGHRRAQVVEAVAVDEGDVRQTGAEVEPVLVLPGDGHGAVSAAVVGVLERYDAVLGVREILPRMGAGQLQRALHGLRTAGGVEDAAHAREMA